MKITLSKLKTIILSALTECLVSASKSRKYILIITENPLLKAVEEEYKTYNKLVNKQVYSGKRKG